MAIISKSIEDAGDFLKQNFPVAIPTETVYGLAANALNPKAVNAIYEVKNRPKSNPLIVHIKSKNELTKYAVNIPKIAYELADVFWPGSLTLLLEKSDVIPDFVTSGSKLVALRVPNHPLTLELLNNLDFPLAAPSANPFGYISPTKPQHVLQQIGDKIPFILDGGGCSNGIESTIIGFDNQKVIIYRLGYITESVLKAVLKTDVNISCVNYEKIVTPGMLPYHYSPNTALYLINSVSEIIDKENIGLITFQNISSEIKNHKILSLKGSYAEAAMHLYDYLIELDQLGLDKIYCEKFNDTGLGKTLNERLIKASNKHEH